MAGPWQREFFLITEDPFAVNLRVFDNWLEGNSVTEAAEARCSQFGGGRPSVMRTSPSSSTLFAAPAAGGPQGSPDSVRQYSSDTNSEGSRSPVRDRQFGDLLRQDCAQQYDAFEFLQDALTDPVHFLEFCPVQIAPSARHKFICRYYSLDNRVVREVLRCPSVIKLQGGGDAKALKKLGLIAKTANVRTSKAKRIILNLQRACAWVDHAKTSSNAMAQPPVPALEALGEPLSRRYHSLAFVLLCRFDLWSRATQSLRTENIEEIAAVLLANGAVPPTVVAVATGNQPNRTAASSASPAEGTVLDPSVRDSLRQLETQVIRPKYYDFIALLLQEIAKYEEPIRGHERSLGLFRSNRTNPFNRNLLDPLIAALRMVMALLQSAKFAPFFGALADFAERLKALDFVEPLELFQRCFAALEALSDRETVPARKTLWPEWLQAWRTFLDFLGACTACLLQNKSDLDRMPLQHVALTVSPAESQPSPQPGGGDGPAPGDAGAGIGDWLQPPERCPVLSPPSSAGKDDGGVDLEVSSGADPLGPPGNQSLMMRWLSAVGGGWSRPAEGSPEPRPAASI
mmetsp:Transcript_86735/g.245961  ORF Transcript_86735/g.245961 Transcript_86735/m.245961 type:complete len:572 (+) Transcript_86735:61-1776(+)